MSFSFSILSPVCSQSFLNKIAKGLDKVNEGLDKIAGKPSKYSANKLPEKTNENTNKAYNGVMVRSFSSQVSIVLESCIREGGKVTVTYFLTNNGPDLTIQSLGVKKNILNKTEETLIIDSNGGGHELRYYSIGGANDLSIKLPIPSGVRLRGTLEIYNVPLSIKQFSLINIAGLLDKTTDSDSFVPFSFSFRNVPIYTMQQVLQDMNAVPSLVVKEPSVESLPDENYFVESVIFTDKYTKVDLGYRNTKYNPEAYLTLNDPSEISILVDGKRYPIIGYYGITDRKGDVTIKYNTVGRYSYIFEPVPNNITAFDITGDDLNGITIKSSINIPKTKGMFQSLDTKYNAFYKQPRMTQADRLRYKIDNIKHSDFPKQIPNTKLAKGKLLYKNEKGRIETFLVVVPDQITTEYLVSYDNKGNIIDCINIGDISAYGGDRGYADISGDKIIVYSSYPAEGDEEEGKSVTEFKVTANLKFIKQKGS